MSVLAAVVTMPGRDVTRTLRSLRSQVDHLVVYCNGMSAIPPIVRELADEAVGDPTNAKGSGAKLYWADRWDGLYLGCDDDLEYPPDYVETMRGWVDHWNREAIVTCHGRVLKPNATRFKHATFTAHALRETAGRWLNYPGGCAVAFDTSLHVPANLPGKNVEEACLAVWAQEHRVPIWLVPHAASWLRYLLPVTGNHYTIWADECAQNFKNRDSYLAPQGAKGWTVHEPLVPVAA